MNKIPKIALSGGPNGGKSRSLRELKPELEKLGYTVYTISEAATEVEKSGFHRKDHTTYEFQKQIALYQLKHESALDNMVTNEEKSVIICDRGLMDCRVYLNDEEYEQIKRELSLTEVDMRDRYDAVFHLDSTSTDKNVDYQKGGIRTEDREEAADYNARSLRAWCGNPHYRFIPVFDEFSQKSELLLKEIKAFLGIPKPLEIERKFLIKYPDTDFLMTLPCNKSEINQTYLYNENGRFRLRKRGENGSYIYIKTEKRKISELVREETETRLTETEYNELMQNGIKTGEITKSRYCLMYGGKYYEIDIFPFWKKQAYIEIELNSEDEKVCLPDFIDVIREVTYDPAYKNSSLCNKIPPEDVF